MESNELQDQIGVILQKQQYDLEKGNIGYKYINLSMKSMVFSRQSIVTYSPPPLLIDSPKEYKLKFETLDLLKKLFIQIEHSEKLKEIFVLHLSNYIHKSRNIYLAGGNNTNVSYLAFATLFKLGYFNSALESLVTRKKGSLDISACLKFINDLLRYEYHLLTKPQLIKINDCINQVGTIWDQGENKIKKEILEQVNEIRFKNLKVELDGVNFQINQDKEEIIKRLKIFGLSEKLSIALNKIEEYFWNTSNDGFDYSAAIGKIREFLNLLYEEVALRIEKRTKEKISLNSSNNSDYKAYIKKHLKLDDETTLRNGLENMINGQGSHELISEREYLRITKNINIEFTLLILTKLEKFEQGDKS